jgi:agmatinase
LPLLIGGEHLVTLGSVRAACRRYPDLHILHFDAHADLRNDYLGARLCHACVIRRCHDLLGDGRIHQFCIRSGEREEFRFAKDHTDLHPFSFDGLEQVVRELEESQATGLFHHTIWIVWILPRFPRNRNAGGRRRDLPAAAGGHSAGQPDPCGGSGCQ